MTSQLIPFPGPASRHVPMSRQVSIDGEYFDDDLPPELFDTDEDKEDLGIYIHMAEAVHDE